VRLRVVIVGIPGVGKTTVVDKLKSKLKGAKLVTFGTVMLDEGTKRRWIKHRDELRKLPVEKQKQLQNVAAKKIASMRDKVVLVDTHLFIRTSEGFWPGLPFDVVRALQPTHLVLIEAKPEEILARRRSDATRYRDRADSGELLQEMSIARDFLSVSSTLSGAPMMMVTNPDGKADRAAGEITKALKGASN
jgi:adenylate kinase